MPNCREDSTKRAQSSPRWYVRSSVRLTEAPMPSWYSLYSLVSRKILLNLSVANFADTEVCMQLYCISAKGLPCKRALALPQFLNVILYLFQLTYWFLVNEQQYPMLKVLSLCWQGPQAACRDAVGSSVGTGKSWNLSFGVPADLFLWWLSVHSKTRAKFV